MRNPVLILAAAIAALALGLGLWSWQQWARQNVAAAPYASATVLETPRELPPFALTDHTNSAFTRETLVGNWHLLFFGYTHCPDVCPNTLGILHGVNSTLKHGKNAMAPKIVFISVDPKRDKPKQLAAYIRYFDPDFLAATGPAEELRKLTRALYLPYSDVPAGSKGDYSVDHSGVLVLLNPQGKAVAYFSPPHRIDAMVADLRRLIHPSSTFVQGCSSLQVHNAWIRETPPGINVAAAYMMLTNSSGKPIVITDISSPDFSRAEFHSMSMDNGNVHMEKLNKIIVPPHGQFALEPDSNHAMLFDPRDRLASGSNVSLVLKCETGMKSFSAPVLRDKPEDAPRHG